MLDGCTPWPEDFVDRYWMGGHWRGQTLDALLRERTAAGVAGTALVHGGTRLTYGQLNRRVDRMAAGFKLRGILARQRVVVQLPAVPESVIAVFALLRAGAVPVVCPTAYRAEDLARTVHLAQAVGYVGPSTYGGFDHTEAAARIAQGPFLRRVFTWEPTGQSSPFGGATVDGAGCHYYPLASVDAPPEPMPSMSAGEVALLLPGDAGRLVPRTHNDFACQLRAAGEALALHADDVYLVTAGRSESAAAGLGCPGVVGALLAGATVVLEESGAADGVGETAALVSREGVTVADADAGPGWGPDEAGGVRLVRDRVRGSAEGVVLRGPAAGGGWVLSACADDDIRVAGGTDGGEVAEGDLGELLLRGPHVVRGYYRAPGDDRFRADGFFRTGMTVRRQPDGTVAVVWPRPLAHLP